MKLVKSASLLAVLFTIHLKAASVTVTSTATCTTNLGTVVTTLSCSLADSLGNTFTATSTAGASPSYSLSGNSLIVNLAVSASEHVVDAGNGIAQQYDSALATSGIMINLVTTGPIRSGFVELVGGNGIGFSGLTAGGSGAASFGLNGGTIQSCSGTGSDPLCSLLFNRPGNSDFLPITLGTNLQFAGSASASVSFDGSFNGGGSGAVSPQLLFFEADQATPVDVLLATPEPHSWTLLLSGLGALLSGYRLKRSQVGN